MGHSPMLVVETRQFGLGDFARAVRPKMAFFAVTLLLGSGVCLSGSVDLVTCFAAGVAAFLVSAIVVWNDYFDREHDKQKGRVLATAEPTSFGYFVVGMWLVTLGGVGGLFFYNVQAGGIFLVMAFLGWIYGWLRHFPLVSGVTVGVCYGCLALIAATLVPNPEPTEVVGLFGAITAFVFGRETVSDLEDLRIDGGYKATLPVVFGRRAGIVAIALCTLVAMACMYLINPLGLVCTPLAVWLIQETRREPLSFRRVYRGFDLLSLCFLLLVFFF